MMLDPNVIAALITLIGMFVVGILSHRQIRKREIRARHFSHKLEAYKTLVTLFFDLFGEAGAGKTTSQQQLVKKFVPIKKDLTMWAGKRMLNAWGRFEMAAQEAQADPVLMLRGFEDVINAIREDLENERLPRGEIVSLIVKAGEERDNLLRRLR